MKGLGVENIIKYNIRTEYRVSMVANFIVHDILTAVP